jgi:hypothetical protein
MVLTPVKCPHFSEQRVSPATEFPRMNAAYSVDAAKLICLGGCV